MNKILPYKKAEKQLGLREKTGQLFMPAAFINDTEEEIRQLEALIAERHVGGLCFFHSRASAATNFEEANKKRPDGKSVPVGKIAAKGEIKRNEASFDTLKSLISRYQAVAKYPLLIAIDAEWGLAMRIENTPQYPYAITLGALADNRTDLIYEVGAAIARDCRAAGIHWNLSPCVDINNNPDNPVIGYRSFGADKFKVTEMALAYIKGTQSEGILSSIKHFPGHGDTATDSHLELPLIGKPKSKLIENELHPFQILIDEGVDSVMIGHLSVPALADGVATSSSLSKEIIKGVLRDEMGYRGVVISDALNMHAVTKDYPVKGELEWLAFNAGNDVLCFADHVAEGVETILKKASEEQIEASFKRIWELKEKVFGEISPGEKEQSPNLQIEENGSNAAAGTDPKTNPSPRSNLNTNSGSTSDSQSKSDSGLTSSSNSVSSTDSNQTLKNPDELNRKIATESLTLLKGSESDVSDFRISDFIGISIPQNADNPFFTSIQKIKEFKAISSTDGSFADQENILLSIFPPQVKPTDKFGFSNEELIFINELIQTKNVVLYLFGNPFVMNHIDYKKAEAVVVAYQNFEVFQDLAADHFLGNLMAKGKLPVKIHD